MPNNIFDENDDFDLDADTDVDLKTTAILPAVMDENDISIDPAVAVKVKVDADGFDVDVEEDEIGYDTDSLKTYMREMGSIPLLKRQEELEIAKKIEEGRNEVLGAILQWPKVYTLIIQKFEEEIQKKNLKWVLVLLMIISMKTLMKKQWSLKK